MAFMANKSKRGHNTVLLDLFAGLGVSFPCLAFLLALAVSELVPFVVLKYESFPGPFDFVGHRWGSGPIRLWKLTIKGKIRDKRSVGRWG